MEVIYERNPRWRFTSFYGILDRARIRESWNLLRTLSRDNSLPWCVIGDYNDIPSNDDKRGNVDHTPLLIRGFRETLMDCNLHNLPMIGYKYTWVRSRGNPDATEERLDRTLVTQNWLDIFRRCKRLNAMADRSDHSLIVLKLYDTDRRSGRKAFRSENAWLQEPELNDIVTAE